MFVGGGVGGVVFVPPGSAGGEGLGVLNEENSDFAV